MLEALGWGLLAQSSLLIAGLLVCWVTVPTKVVGVPGGFGAGAMIAAVSFDLLPEGQGPYRAVAGVHDQSRLRRRRVYLDIPQVIAPSADLAASGWSARKLGGLWLLVVLACGLAAVLGYLRTDASGSVQGDRAAALAAGGLLAMLTNSLIPFSFERGGALAGAATGLGFCLSVTSS
jgi:zinc transporter ZupT